MPSLKTIRKRITSVKATQKITRAMKMVAGARLNRAQQRITALRPYALKTREVLDGVAATMANKQLDAEFNSDDRDEGVHPLLQRRPERTVLILLLSGDRGEVTTGHARRVRGQKNKLRKSARLIVNWGCGRSFRASRFSGGRG